MLWLIVLGFGFRLIHMHVKWTPISVGACSGSNGVPLVSGLARAPMESH